MLATTFLDLLKRTGQPSAICAVVGLSSGCVGNHAFVRGADLDVPGLVGELEKLEDEDDALVRTASGFRQNVRGFCVVHQ